MGLLINNIIFGIIEVSTGAHLQWTTSSCNSSKLYISFNTILSNMEVSIYKF